MKIYPKKGEFATVFIEYKGRRINYAAARVKNANFERMLKPVDFFNVKIVKK